MAKAMAARLLPALPRATQTRLKEWAELRYWRHVLHVSDGTFYNGHFETRFTDLFGLEPSHFAAKRMLDVGRGPSGSLEWATMAAERVGVDPLASRYLALNEGGHAMTYVEAGAEALPFEDGHFDVVSSFNALDHVEDARRAVAEAQRVLAPGGDLLLIVEVGHPPTVTEPQTLDEDVLDAFDACRVVSRRVVAINDDHNVYGSIAEDRPRASPDDPAILCAHLTKRAAIIDA